ncbi:MAG: RpiB/LacA/LacB family sugar-phosphate isomerase [Candidatus Micrarchaeota archaeon]|nr:RpiB/LacA/LacB family sugar-phosphate isomerase [Candidatus Micrarchaeota archaeon]
MRIAVASDEANDVTRFVLSYLRKRGHKVAAMGALRKKGVEWVDSSRELAEAVAGTSADEGVLFCWTGTGSSIAANKVTGVRAALCVDAEEARGARRWNHANVLVMSLRLTSQALAKEIIDAWLSERYGRSEFDRRNVRKLGQLERKYSG